MANHRKAGTCIRAAALIGFHDLAEQCGGDADALLRSAGIDPSLVGDHDAMLPFHQIVVLLETSATQLNRPSFGLQWTLNSPDHFPALGPLVLLASFTTTLQEWIELAIKYWRFHTDGFAAQLSVEETTGLARMRYVGDPLAPPARQFIECTVANVCQLARIVTEHRQDNPTIVRFQHARPRDTTLHKQLFRCELEFDADHTEVLFDQKYLAYATKGTWRRLKPVVGLYMRHRINQIKDYDASATATTIAAIQTLLGTGQCSLESVSSALGVEPKTLQRRLTAEATTFSTVLQDVRLNIAKRLLIESNISVERIAGLLDYSSTPPFTLAFKRWTSMSPLEFRQNARGAVTCS